MQTCPLGNIGRLGSSTWSLPWVRADNIHPSYPIILVHCRKFMVNTLLHALVSTPSTVKASLSSSAILCCIKGCRSTTSCIISYLHVKSKTRVASRPHELTEPRRFTPGGRELDLQDKIPGILSLRCFLWEHTLGIFGLSETPIRVDLQASLSFLVQYGVATPRISAFVNKGGRAGLQQASSDQPIVFSTLPSINIHTVVA